MFRANIYAQSAAFILNGSAYAISNNIIFIWIELSCLCFIGMNITCGARFFDRNMLNHFITVMLYYILAHLLDKHNFLYLCLIFSFTYFYFILRENGYHKSMYLWMYIQALLIGTTFPGYPFSHKIIASCIAYLEAQLILNLAFRLFSSIAEHVTENNYLKIFKLKWSDWFDLNKLAARLALRGAITAAILYAICSNFHDTKPNWAVVTAISCLQRDDFKGSLMAIKGLAIGSLLALPLAYLLILFCSDKSSIAATILWVSLLIGLVFSFEVTLNPHRLTIRIVGTAAMLLAVICVALALKVNSYNYLNLKIFNSFIGCAIAWLVLLIWEQLKQFFAQINSQAAKSG